MQRDNKTVRVALIFCALSMLPCLHTLGATCVAPSAAAKERVTTYVHDRYQIPSSTSLVLENDSQANTACFWKFSYKVGTTARRLVVYLTPDGGYVVPLLYDLSADPLAETKEAAKLLTSSLSPPTAARLGAASAPVTIVEFSDFECPFCKKTTDMLEQDVLPKEKDKVSLVFRNFPLQMHPWAKLAAEMAECARMQNANAFWPLHDYFFQNQGTLTNDTLRTRVKDTLLESGINESVFNSCLDRDLALGPVTQDISLGQKIGVHGTPTIFINGVLYDGTRDAATLSKVIEEAAAGKPWQQYQHQLSSLDKQTGIPTAGGNECRPQAAQARKGDINAIKLQ